MYEAVATVVGTVVTEPVKRDLVGGEQVVNFRMASNARRLDHSSGKWVANGTLFLTVSCWRKLVDGVHISIRRGDPIIVQGQMRTNEYRTRDGVERRDLEMRAAAVGPDLSRCTAQVYRNRPGNTVLSADADVSEEPPRGLARAGAAEEPVDRPAPAAANGSAAAGV